MSEEKKVVQTTGESPQELKRGIKGLAGSVYRSRRRNRFLLFSGRRLVHPGNGTCCISCFRRGRRYCIRSYDCLCGITCEPAQKRNVRCLYQ